MKNKIFYSILAMTSAALLLASCNSYLDKMPDNRTTIDTENKVKSILNSAYPDHEHIMVTEFMSDNVDEYNNELGTEYKWFLEMGRWKDITENFNESPQYYWVEMYSNIVAANMALEAIEELGGPTNQLLRECKGEALIIRAYCHFQLANIFCMSYNPETAEQDLGVYYQYETGTHVGTANPRGNMKELYEHIEADLLEGLPLIGDTHLDVPKYHFNTKAAYAFASRFYLYYGKWEEVVKYASQCLGTAPETMLRDWNAIAALPTTGMVRPELYVSSQSKANLLLSACYSRVGRAFLNYSVFKHFAHGYYLDQHETFRAEHIWGTGPTCYIDQAATHYSSGNDVNYAVARRIPWEREFTDPVAGTYYHRAIIPLFTTDECLLERAEAYILLKQYDKACADMNLWMHNYTTAAFDLTPENIQDFYKDIAYSYEYTEDDQTGMASTIKKHLNPRGFTIDAEGSVQECMLQCLLNMRRIETIHRGQRWFDVKRYNIVIQRRYISNMLLTEKRDELRIDDPRRAIQVPQVMRDTGVTPNPR